MELSQGGLLSTFVIKCCNCYGTLPFRWNSKTSGGHLQIKSNYKLAFYQKMLIVSVVCTSLVFCQVAYSWKKSTMFVNSFSLEYISAFVMCFPSFYVNTCYPNQMTNLFTSLLKFEQGLNMKIDQNVNLNRRKLRFWTNLVVKMTALCVFSMLPFQLNALIQPCFPVYFGYWLSSHCESNNLGAIKISGMSLQEFRVRLGMTVLSFANWSFLIPAVISQLCLMMVMAHCFRCYLEDVTSMLRTRRNVEYSWLKMREIQVMLNRCCGIYSGFVLPSIAAGGMFAQVATLYLSIDLVRNGQVGDQKAMMIACTWVAFAMALVFWFVYGALGDVSNVGKRERRKFKGCRWLMEDKWFRRAVKGYPLLGIRLGEYSVLNRMTPLNIENMVVEQTVNFLLV